MGFWADFFILPIIPLHNLKCQSSINIVHHVSINAEEKESLSTLKMWNGLGKVKEINSGMRMSNGIKEIENGTKSTETKK